MRGLFFLQVLGLLLVSVGCARSKVEYQEIFRDNRIHVRLAETREKSGEVVPKGYDHPWDLDILTLGNSQLGLISSPLREYSTAADKYSFSLLIVEVYAFARLHWIAYKGFPGFLSAAWQISILAVRQSHSYTADFPTEKLERPWE